MLPPNDRPAAQSIDGATAMRLKVQRKTWRARKFFESQSRQERCVLLLFLGTAIEHLMLRLDHLDERGRGIWDIALDDMSPFVACRRYLYRALVGGSRPGSILYSIFRHFSNGSALDGNRLMCLAREMVLDMSGQVIWRFLPYTEVPLSLMQVSNPGLPSRVREENLGKVFSRHSCCNDSGCTQKIVKKYTTSKKMLACVAMMDGLIVLAHKFKFTNLISERLIALVRRACHGGMGSHEIEANL